MRILLTGIGGPAGGSLATQLSQRGHWVGGVDLRPTSHPDASAFRSIVAASDPGYLTELAAIAREWQVDAVIPSVSEELGTLSRRRGDLGIPVLVGEPEAVVVADDKYRTACRLARRGVAVPPFGLVGEFRSAREAMADLGGAIVVKPRVSRGGRDVRVIEPEHADGRDTVDYWSRLDERMIIQRFAPGIEYAPVVFRASGFDDVCVVLQKLELREGRVGNAVAVTRVESGADDIRQLALAAATAIGLTGPADIDVRRDADGSPVVLEINARFGANSAHAPELLDAVLEGRWPVPETARG